MNLIQAPSGVEVKGNAPVNIYLKQALENHRRVDVLSSLVRGGRGRIGRSGGVLVGLDKPKISEEDLSLHLNFYRFVAHHETKFSRAQGRKEENVIFFLLYCD